LHLFGEWGAQHGLKLRHPSLYWVVEIGLAPDNFAYWFLVVDLAVSIDVDDPAV
jgi:hypothetical protein